MTVIEPNALNALPSQRRSWLSSVAYRALGETGTKVGVGWLGVVMCCAVFAPLLANSHPILAKVDGHWSSPLVKHLSPSDVILFVLVPLGLFLARLRSVSGTARWLAFGVVGTVVIVTSVVLVRPPQIVVYEQWREAEKSGRMEWAVRAPIPFSPTDRMRDLFRADDPHPWSPRAGHWLGTDRNGSDVLSRMIHACRIALAVGFIAEGIAVVIGVSLGGLMGYRGGWVDLLGMRLVEIFSAIPQLYLLLTFVAFFDRNLYLIMAIIGLTSWTGYALFTRAEFLRLRQLDFVHAAVASGTRTPSIIFRHILPNGLTPVLTSLSFGVASAILAETSLSFLGLGLVEEPSWGGLLNQAVSDGGGFYWWLATFPGIGIFLTVLAYNLIGESLRDALDPKLSGGQ